MKKFFAIFKREYLSAVRKKMFIIMTFLTPALLGLVMAVPGALMRRGMGEKNIVIIDGTGRLSDVEGPKAPGATKSFGGMNDTESLRLTYVDASRTDEAALTRQYLGWLAKSRADAVVVVPRFAIDPETNTKIVYYSRSAADIIAQQRVSRKINEAVLRLRLEKRGIPAADVDAISRDLEVDSVQLSRSGEQKRGGELNLAVGFVFAALLVVPVFVYGIEIMRSIVQEKTDRVVEILISSVSSFQLLAGKIFGIAAVGLTQLGIWILLGSVMTIPSVVGMAAIGVNVLQFLRPAVFGFFALFFMLGYLLLVCIYAIGGAVSNSEKDAQQLLAPIVMFMMIPWFLLVPIITNPESRFAVTLSLVPIFTPIVMFIRILVSEPPIWQIVVSVILTMATIAMLMYVTAKIFRVGILAYGKRPTIPELLRWIRFA